MSAKDYIKQQFLSYKNLASIAKNILSQFNIAEIRKKIAEIIDKLSNLARTNYELGLYHLKFNHLPDAIFRFKIAKRLNKSYVEADYYIALCYYDEFQYEKAKPYLIKYLTLDKVENLESARFLLNVVNGEVDELKCIPSSIIAHKFEQIITEYGSRALGEIPFEAQKQLLLMTAQYLQASNDATNVTTLLDLGCGIGTIAVLARKAKIASLIYGVDLSPHMADISRKEKFDEIPLYNAVINEEALSYMEKIAQTSQKFDIIFASDLLCYIAKIENLLLLSKQLLNSQGAIAVTFRLSTDESEASTFDPHIQQFAFAPEYIIQAASQHGFKVNAQQETTLLNGDAGLSMVLTIL